MQQAVIHVDILKSGYWLCPQLVSKFAFMTFTTIATHPGLFLCAVQSIEI